MSKQATKFKSRRVSDKELHVFVRSETPSLKPANRIIWCLFFSDVSPWRFACYGKYNAQKKQATMIFRIEK
jgi:membrane protein CcdC involved in cytochrome C biogenesis